MIKDSNMLLNFQFSLDLLKENKKNEFLSELAKSEELGIEEIRGWSMDDSTDIYRISGADGESLGVIGIRENTSKDNAKEILLRQFHEFSPDETKDILNGIITELCKDNNVEYIIYRIQEDDEELQAVVESLGFIKDGLYISNHQSGEFIYYSVYSYKLI